MTGFTDKLGQARRLANFNSIEDKFNSHLSTTSFNQWIFGFEQNICTFIFTPHFKKTSDTSSSVV